MSWDTSTGVHIHSNSVTLGSPPKQKSKMKDKPLDPQLRFKLKYEELQREGRSFIAMVDLYHSVNNKFFLNQFLSPTYENIKTCVRSLACTWGTYSQKKNLFSAKAEYDPVIGKPVKDDKDLYFLAALDKDMVPIIIGDHVYGAGEKIFQNELDTWHWRRGKIKAKNLTLYKIALRDPEFYARY